MSDENTTEDAARRGSIGCLARLLITLGVILLVLLAVGWFATPTEGARDLIEGRLTKRLGIGVSVEQARIELPYVLVLRDVLAVGGGDTPLLRAKVVECRPGWGRVTVVCRDVQLELDVGATGAEDSLWVRAATLPMGDFGTVSALLSHVATQCDLRVKNGAVRWVGAEGQPLCTVTGMELDIRAEQVADRPMTYCRVRTGAVTGPGGLAVEALTREWLSAPAHPVLWIRNDVTPLSEWGRRFLEEKQ